MPGGVVLATSGFDHSIRLWEPPSGFCYRTLQFSDSQVNRLAISPDKRYLVAAGNPHIRLYELDSNNPQHCSAFNGHKGNVVALGFDASGRTLYSGSEDGTLKLWDVATAAMKQEFVHGEPCNTVALHPNQDLLICGYQDGRVKVYSQSNGQCIDEQIPDRDESGIRSVDINPSGQICAVGTSKGMVYLYSIDASTWKLTKVKEFQAHDQYLLKVLYSPNGAMLATCSADHSAKIWDVNRDYQLSWTLTGHQRWVWDCAFTSSSTYLITTSSDHVARLWDLQMGETVRHYTGHRKSVTCVALHDGGTAGTGGYGGGASSQSSSSSHSSSSTGRGFRTSRSPASQGSTSGRPSTSHLHPNAGYAQMGNHRATRQSQAPPVHFGVEEDDELSSSTSFSESASQD